MKRYKINSKSDFITYLNQLIQDNNTAVNKNLKEYLESIVSYTEDIQGFYDNNRIKMNSDEPSWQLFADILTGAIIYE